MENNLRKKLKSTKGITLVALVVTIIVLLILAGVALSSVLSQDGIFSRAEQATDKYGQAKARETLELALGEAQMKKYDEGLTEEELDEQIKKVGSLIPKEDPDSNNQLVIVEGHIFEIDRSVPKIVDYKGPADGIIITASVSQNGNWQNPVATVTGTITKYGGGSVVSSSATATNGVTIPADFPTTGGSFTIPNITTDTDITIIAKDSEGHDPVTEVIKVRLVRDNTPPELSNAKAEVDRMKIKISVIATDNESGLKQINYSVSPATIEPATGTLTSGQVIELTATEEREYTVTFTATDNAGNTSAQVTAKATTIDGMTVAEVKKTVNASNIADYIGTKVIDYETGAIWRVFYYDAEDADHPKGYFGDGDGTGPRAGTIYLKRDYDSTKTVDPYNSYRSTTPSTEAVNYMKQLNPLWRDASNGSAIDLDNERVSASFYEQNIYGSYKNNTYSTYAVGAPPIEMWCKTQNIYKAKYDTTASTIGCGIMNTNGYGYTINGESLVHYQNTIVVNTSIEQSKVIATSSYQWLASPSSRDYCYGCAVFSGRVDGSINLVAAFCPVVPLNL